MFRVSKFHSLKKTNETKSNCVLFCLREIWCWSTASLNFVAKFQKYFSRYRGNNPPPPKQIGNIFFFMSTCNDENIRGLITGSWYLCIPSRKLTSGIVSADETDNYRVACLKYLVITLLMHRLIKWCKYLTKMWNLLILTRDWNRRHCFWASEFNWIIILIILSWLIEGDNRTNLFTIKENHAG